MECKKMNPWRNHVRVIGPQGETIYGIFRKPWGRERKPKKGYAFIEEAITGQTYEVHESRITDLPQDFDGEYDKYVEARFNEAQEHSWSLPKGVRPGKLISTGVGDGYAFYVITKVNKRGVTLEWRGYSLDRWSDQVLGGGGVFPLRAIEPLVRRSDSDLFRPKLEKLSLKSGKREE
ncbi:MAG: hypothetical protein ABFE07_28975 [Armatimonadia bacterium]